MAAAAAVGNKQKELQFNPLVRSGSGDQTDIRNKDGKGDYYYFGNPTSHFERPSLDYWITRQDVMQAQRDPADKQVKVVGSGRRTSSYWNAIWNTLYNDKEDTPTTPIASYNEDDTVTENKVVENKIVEDEEKSDRGVKRKRQIQKRNTRRKRHGRKSVRK